MMGEEQQVVETTSTPVAPTGVIPNSGAGVNNGPFPAELKGWNWGAFFLGWIWAIAHSTWIGLAQLLVFIPFIGPVIGIITIIMLGLKGNEWAWQKRKFANVEEFKAVEKAWAKWGVILFALSLLVSIAMFAIVGAAIFSSISENGFQ